METRLLPAPGSDDAGATQTQSRSNGPQLDAGPKSVPVLPTVDEILARLAAIPGLVMLGLLTPARANAITASLRELLRYLSPSTTNPDRATLADRDVLELACRDPKILNMIAPLLTPEQIDLVLRDDADAQ